MIASPTQIFNCHSKRIPSMINITIHSSNLYAQVKFHDIQLSICIITIAVKIKIYLTVKEKWYYVL